MNKICSSCKFFSFLVVKKQNKPREKGLQEERLDLKIVDVILPKRYLYIKLSFEHDTMKSSSEIIYTSALVITQKLFPDERRC